MRNANNGPIDPVTTRAHPESPPAMQTQSSLSPTQSQSIVSVVVGVLAVLLVAIVAAL